MERLARIGPGWRGKHGAAARGPAAPAHRLLHGGRLRTRIAILVVAAALTSLAAPAVGTAATFTVNSTNDPGVGTCDATECTLREAITAANAAGGTDTIAFNILGVPTIQPTSPLPAISDPAIVDGTTQPGFVASPIVQLDGSLAGATGSGITLSGGSSTVRGLVINRFAPAANQQGGGVYVPSFGGGNDVIEGNYIGTDVTGTLALGNSSGVFLSGTGGNRVGGTTAGARNIIADNKAPNGAGIWTVSPNNVIQGNYIGTNATGTSALANGFGLVITGGSNVIGGTTAGARNVISGNTTTGLEICANCGAAGTTGNVVQGNYIGTNASGTAAVANVDNFGGAVLVRATGNTVGGTAPGAGNVISGNSGVGVAIGLLFGNSPPTNNNLVAGNLIGTAADGVTPLGNTAQGVYVGFSTPASQNTIGGVTASARNTIANNGQAGVFVEASSNQNSVLGNSIFSNSALGIDLSPAGVTPNDVGDADTGANDLQNFPVLTGMISGAGSTTVFGTLNSQASKAYRLEFFSNASCDSSANGEGRTFLGSSTVTTNGSGNVAFASTVPTAVAAGDVVTSTATDPAGNTSEFSNCAAAVTGAAGKVSARGTVNSGTATFSAANDCTAANSSRPSIVEWGSRRFTKTTVTSSRCFDDPAVPTPPAGFDTQIGSANGTLEDNSSATLTWTYVDAAAGGSPSDKVQFQVKNSIGAVILDLPTQSAASLGGTPGGVWTFPP